jgi:hypothetical protein
MILTGAARRTRTISGSLGRWNPATRSRRRLCWDSSGAGDRSHRLGPNAWLSSWRSRKSGSAACRAGLSLRKAPGSPPGGSDLPSTDSPRTPQSKPSRLGRSRAPLYRWSCSRSARRLRPSSHQEAATAALPGFTVADSGQVPTECQLDSAPSPTPRTRSSSGQGSGVGARPRRPHRRHEHLDPFGSKDRIERLR